MVFVNFVIAEALEDALRQRGERGLRRADGGSVGFAGASSCERWRRRCKLVTGLGGIVLAQPLQDSPQGRWTIVLATLIMRPARALQAGDTRTAWVPCDIIVFFKWLGRVVHRINVVIRGGVLKVQGVSTVFIGVR